MKKEERLRLQQEKLIRMKEREDDLHRRGRRFVAGVDEVGRGPLAGPVVAAAVVLPPDFDVPGIDDSKKLSEKRREALFDVIMERADAVGIGQVSPQVIDEINILEATKQAMNLALEEAGKDLARRQGEGAGDSMPGDPAFGAPAIDFVLLDALTLEGLPIPQQGIVKGDANVLCIAAASIIAKVTRDRMMVAWDEEYPGYAFASNKGYGTKAHYDGLKAQGMCPIHRRTFLKNLPQKG